MQVKVLFFANFRELLGMDKLSLEIAEASDIGHLCALLAQRGAHWQQVFHNPKAQLKIAVNQEMAEFDQKLVENDEVAFFPPVTGG